MRSVFFFSNSHHVLSWLRLGQILPSSKHGLLHAGNIFALGSRARLIELDILNHALPRVDCLSGFEFFSLLLGRLSLIVLFSLTDLLLSRRFKLLHLL